MLGLKIISVVKTKKVKVNMKLQINHKFDEKLADRNSDEFKTLEEKVLEKFEKGFREIAEEKKMVVEVSVSFEEEQGYSYNLTHSFLGKSL